MIVIGLTGGIGCGKGYCAKIFSRFGIPSLDTDVVSRIVTDKGGECLRELVEHFGEDILDSSGLLKRKTLAAKAFKTKSELAALNSITHKHILAYAENWINEQKKNNLKACIIEAPLLFESGFNSKCSIIISVLCQMEERIKRVMDRDGLSEEETERRISSQHSDTYFINNSDYIIHNGPHDNPEKQIEKIISLL